MSLKHIQAFCMVLFFSAMLTQSSAFAQKIVKKDTSKVAAGKDFTISYSLQVISSRGNSGIGETYNGGVKTIFLSGNKIRTRLVSLMRIESIFQFPKNKANKIAAIAKESGKLKYRYLLTKDEWKRLNAKYDSANTEVTGDTLTILNYSCKKAIITLKDGRSINLYFTDSIKRKDIRQADPLFAFVPGLVLQYEYTYKKGSITYTATTISVDKIDPVVFRVPSKGLVTRKFTMKPLSENSTEIPIEEESGDDDDKDQ